MIYERVDKQNDENSDILLLISNKSSDYSLKSLKFGYFLKKTHPSRGGYDKKRDRCISLLRHDLGGYFRIVKPCTPLKNVDYSRWIVENLLRARKSTRNFSYISLLLSLIRIMRSRARWFLDVFKKGVLYKGIFCPSLTNSFHNKQLESSYLHYSNRQRQKSLIMLNIVDLSLKVSNAKSKPKNKFHHP